jgi:membrane associated rhomboid family serine protease
MKPRAAGDTGADGASSARSDSERILADARSALLVMASVIAFIWLVQVVNSLDHYGLSRHFGVVSREPSRLPDIFSAPFLHWSYAHIEANSAPLFFLGFLAAYRGVRRFVGVSLLIVITSGIGSWLFSPIHTVSAGASGVVFGYFGYVALRGIVERHLIDVVVGLVVAVSYWSILQGVLPSDPHISWQAHLFGLLGGIAAALMLRERKAGGPARAGPTKTAPAPVAGDGSRASLHKELDDLGL